MKREAKKIEWAGVEDMPPLAVSLSSMRVNKTGTWRQMRPVIDYGKCKNCGICWKYCPEPAIVIENERFVIDYEYCKGCGICAVECPVGAISMVSEIK